MNTLSMSVSIEQFITSSLSTTKRSRENLITGFKIFSEVRPIFRIEFLENLFHMHTSTLISIINTSNNVKQIIHFLG